MKLTLLEILEATGGAEAAASDRGNSFESFHTDSREVLPGGVFFALRGAEMDGHKFIGDAVARGAAAIVAERPAGVTTGVTQVLVRDAWAALYSVAAYTLDRIRPLVVAVTGSNGKTSTKEMAAAILALRYNVLRTQGNLNTETGVPLTVLRLEPHHTALVLEMGMQKAGDLQRLASLAKPRIGIVTNIGTVHMEFFESRSDLERAKGELVAALSGEGLAVLNADSEYLPLLAQMTSARIATFGRDRGDYRVEGYRVLAGGGAAFSVRGVEVRIGMAGSHQALNAAAALAAGEGAGVELATGAAALAGVTVDHRLQELPTAAGFTVVDDAYNASPESMLAAFEALAEKSGGGRLLAVLGEMGELGGESVTSHERVGRRAADVFDAVCVVESEYGRVLAESSRGELVPDREGAMRWVRHTARPGDRVLIKGSHSLHLEKVVEGLTAS
jgi:UDP-N-acetylmuramoyl-tripeptide--D-alanyl-D-alanine ligase